ncbi:PAS domain S-box protein [Ectobacillus funiculus]|uniref:PAS domain S-box protein n=1 Tax=Ectobacillus funiculus TaxID=137993 RepID=UPI00397DE8B1
MNKKKVLIAYITLSVIWLYATDSLLETYIDTFDIALWQRVKGSIYIAIVGGFIYFLLKKEEKLQHVKQEEQRLSTLINAMVDFVNFKDGEGRWILANEFGLKLFHLEHVDYRGKKDSELAQYTSFYKEALEYCEISDEETWQAGELTHCEESVPLPDGTFKVFHTIKVPLFFEDGSRKGLVVIGRDITERKEAKKQLEESEQRYKSLFEYNPDLVYMIDLQGNITNLNPIFEDLIGYKKEDVIGTSILSFISEKDKERVTDEFSRIIATGVSSKGKELEIVRRDGMKMSFECTSVPIIIENKVVGVTGYAKDVTKIKETEERLRRAEKLSIVGELAASVAHEIRNPLTSLKGFVQLLQQGDAGQTHYYNIMLNELDRINHIVGELLVLAKPQTLRFKKDNIISIVEDVKALLESQTNLYSAEIDIKAEQNLPLIECESNQLKQLFINLIKNSVEAGATKIQVALSRTKENMVLVRVRDNGCGIPEQRIKHLGEPFFSYKEKGTGLGLTVSYRIVESHKGRIVFKSEVNQGTEVEIMLPIYNKS